MIMTFLSLMLIFELIQLAALVNFMLHLSILKILKISFWTFLKKSCISLDLWANLSWKLYKAFRIAECKQPRLGKPCLISDLYFISKTFCTDLIEAIVSYKLLSSLSQENRKALFPALLGTSTIKLKKKKIKPKEVLLTFLVSVFLCHNLASSMLKYEGSLT